MAIVVSKKLYLDYPLSFIDCQLMAIYLIPNSRGKQPFTPKTGIRQKLSFS